MHIITYATHNSGYFSTLLQSYPDIKVLGWGRTWKGLSDKIFAVMEFCRQCKPDDIVCFVDGFDSVILASKEEIHKTYIEICSKTRKSMIVSRAGNAPNSLGKYVQDKLFGKCYQDRLNSGMFIGTASSILQFWSGYNRYDDDQEYATRICKRVDYLYIDTSCRLFYNYSPVDNVRGEGRRIVVFGEKPCIISAPTNRNITALLETIGMKVTYVRRTQDTTYRLTTYLGKFLVEIIGLCVIIGLIILYYKGIIGLLILVIGFMAVVIYIFNYEVNVKHLPTTEFRKFLFMLSDILHSLVFLTIIYLLFNPKCNVLSLMLLNILYLFIILCFFLFKRCILTILTNRIVSSDYDSQNISMFDIGRYFIQREYELKINNNHESQEEYTKRFMKGNLITVSLVLALNIYCFIRIYFTKSCSI